MSGPPRALVATDLDGTLLRADGSVSARTRAALAAARQAKVEVVFITGRPPMFLPAVLAETGHTGAVICANGSVVLDAATLEPTKVDAFTPAALREVLDRMVALIPDGEYRTMMYRPGEPSIRLIGTGPDYPEVVDAHLAGGWQGFKLAVIGPSTQDPDSFLAFSTAAFGHVAEVTHSTPGTALVEIGPAGVTKGSALVTHAASRGVALADVYAVGDMPNDVSMLAVAGRSHAVANAHPAVLAAVDDVLPSNADDGVAQLLERLIGAPQGSPPRKFTEI